MPAVIEKAIIRARLAFTQDITKGIEFRVSQLNALYRCLEENRDVLIDAVKQDFQKPAFETVVTEIDFVKNDIKDQLLNIKKYMKPKTVPKNLFVMMDEAFIHNEPYGLVLVIGAWNYPIQLTLCPLIGAITAGNCAIIKPSEISPVTAQALAELIPRYLDNECYHVITGGPEDTQQLLKEKFDYIFFTGSTHIGKIVYESAAKHLTPVTLELGGKSPLYIDETVPNMEMAWRRILWGKFVNAGQTCVAPDYVLCTSKVQQTLVESAAKIIKEFYGDEPKNSADFSRIINAKHFDRISKLISSSDKPIIGGVCDSHERYISPTILINVSPSDPIMNEEVFGPVLPIVSINSAQEAIDFIKKGDKPLSMYLFTTKSDVLKKFLNETSSGSVCVNDTIHLSIDSLPFGGVGASGIGAYHGRYSFETFSHPKSVLVRGYNPILETLGSKRYPPYSEKNIQFLSHMIFLSQLLRKSSDYTPKYWSQYLMFALGIITVLGMQCIF